MSEALIRKMNEADVPAVAELEKACFSMPWSENSIRSELENELSLWLVAELDGKVCGYVGSQTVLDESDVMNVAVADCARGHGIGSALMRELMDAGTECGTNWSGALMDTMSQSNIRTLLKMQEAK